MQQKQEQPDQDSLKQEASSIQLGKASGTARKFSLTVCLLILLAMCVFWLISNYSTQNLLRQQADSLGQSLAQLTANQLTELVLSNDLVSMNVILGSLVEEAAIAEVAVLNINNQLMAAAEGRPIQTDLVVPLPIELTQIESEYVAPIELVDSIAGYVRLRLDLSYIEAGLVNNFLFIAAAAILLLIVAGSLIALYFQYLIHFPAKLLAYALSNIRQGKLETVPEPDNNNELSVALRQFNATAEFLAQNTFLDSFNHSQQDEDFNQTAANKEDNITLLCIQLVNFQYLSSTLEKTNLTELLNRYYFFTGKIAQLYNGKVTFCADGEVIVSFCSERLEEEQAFYAICAGQLFLQLKSVITDDAENIDAKFGLAVHNNLGIRSWSPITGDYDNLSGKVLDQVRQICRECPDGGLLISEASFQQAGAGTRVDAELFSQLQLDETSKIFLAQQPMADYRVLLERQAQQLSSLYQD